MVSTLRAKYGNRLRVLISKITSLDLGTDWTLNVATRAAIWGDMRTRARAGTSNYTSQYLWFRGYPAKWALSACVSMAGRALLAGYPRFVITCHYPWYLPHCKQCNDNCWNDANILIFHNKCSHDNIEKTIFSMNTLNPTKSRCYLADGIFRFPFLISKVSVKNINKWLSF